MNKMAKRKRIILFTIICICIIIVGGCLYHFRHLFLGTSNAPVKALKNEDFGLPDFHSSTDKDGDGVDDASDILAGARAYIAAKPSYKSKYYDTGYPDDNYGVCTDVVAQALLHAGYDLMELVQEDILAHPEDYDIAVPDAKIDFRRVKNLKVYFARTALSLTTDPTDIGQWQGGDIVIFENHIGIVSDMRNKRGVPYVIHHSGPFQAAYEEDILESRGDIVGHYRVSQ